MKVNVCEDSSGTLTQIIVNEEGNETVNLHKTSRQNSPSLGTSSQNKGNLLALSSHCSPYAGRTASTRLAP